MNKTLKISLLALLTIGIFSCKQTYKIDRDDFTLVPYTGKELLIFESSKKELDTIFLKGFDQYMVESDPLAIFPNKYEVYSLNCEFKDSKYDRYLPGSLMELHSFSDSQTHLEFNVSLKRISGNCTISKVEIEKQVSTEWTFNGTKLNDIKILRSDIYTGNHPEKIYWSMSEGLMGIEGDNDKWNLKKKYVP